MLSTVKQTKNVKILSKKRHLLIISFIFCILLISCSNNSQRNTNSDSSRNINNDSQINVNNNSEPNDSKIEMSLDYNTMADAISRLNASYKSRICFEELDFDKVSDGITAKQAITDWEKRSETRSLTVREKDAYDSLRNNMAQGRITESTRVDIKSQRFYGSYSGNTIGDVLDKLTSGSQYKWKENNGTYVVFPKDMSVLDFPVSLSVSNKKLGDVIQNILSQGSQRTKFALAEFHIGLKPYPNIEERVIANLDIENIKARDALCQAVETVGSNVVWTLLGFKGEREIYLSLP